MPKLTKTIVSELRAQPKTRFVWDESPKGFGVKVTPAGRKVFVIQHRKNGKTVRHNIGPFGVFTVEEARHKAVRTLYDAKDPDAVHARITVGELWEKYRASRSSKWKRNTARNYQVLYDRYIGPGFGSTRAGQLRAHEITEKIVIRLAETPRTANLAIDLLTAIVNFGIDQQLLPHATRNPASVAGKERHKIAGRDKALSVDQMRAMFSAISELEDRHLGLSRSAAGALRTLAYTGARLREVIEARWEWVEMLDDAAIVHLPDSKTGPKDIFLTGPALDAVRSMERVEGNAFVFPGQKPGRPLADISTAWRRVCIKARIPYGRKGFVVHDLRHTFVTMGANSGVSLTSLGKAVGHSSERMTQRYANPDRAAAIAAAKQTVKVMHALAIDDVTSLHGAK
jgi:integrase